MNEKYKILFDPIKIGPVTSKNRFYQVPHCTGMGWQRPNMLASMREVKAEGGWGVVNTEYCSIHPSSDDLPHSYASLWDKSDIKAHHKMTSKVHNHGALAGVELWYSGANASSQFTRLAPLDVNSRPNLKGLPFQSRKMDKQDFSDLRRWFKQAAIRAREAEFDIIYAYANHSYLLHNFQKSDINDRNDAYGGDTKGRSKFLKEIIEILKEEAGSQMGVAIRFSPDEDNQNDPNETLDFFNEISEMPDLWDLTPSNWDIELGSSRFTDEGDNLKFIDHIKKITTKPVVAVGRFTSVDAMVNIIKKEFVDIIGAARPSIADPFLPKKIEEDRIEDIRECIGCNICYTGDQLGVPIRCTQNPTMGEEWRRGWHPEILPPKKTNDSILVIGCGPSGLEAAHSLGKRDFTVLAAEAKKTTGGRVVSESNLPSLNTWIRVKDYREQQFLKLPNVNIFLNSKMNVKDILDSEVEHVVFATGSNWRSDGFGRSNTRPIKQLIENTNIFNPDDIMKGDLPSGNVVVFDDDYYYLAPIISEMLQKNGCDVTYVTTSSVVCEFGNYTSEQYNYQKSLINSGVKLIFSKNIVSYSNKEIKLSCMYSNKISSINTDALVMITSRLPNDSLYYELCNDYDIRSKFKSVKRIGDCLAPATIASAIYDGRKYAMELEDEFCDNYLFKRDSNLNI